MTIREHILQTARDWAMQTLGLTENEDIIKAEEKGPRPEKPYLTVNAPTHAVPIGSFERVWGSSGGDPTVVVEQGFGTAVSINGYGEETGAWLTDLQLSLALPETQKLWDDEDLTLVQESETRDLSSLLDTAYEPRYQRDFECRYIARGPMQTLTEASTLGLSVDLIRYEDDPETLTTTVQTSL